jgi:hypothetical protein
MALSGRLGTGFGYAVTRFVKLMFQKMNMRCSNWGIMIYFWGCRGR